MSINKSSKKFYLASILLLISQCVVNQLAFADNNDLAKVIKSEHRSQKNLARDIYRHPLETLEFFDVQPTHSVVEIWPGAEGWYTEILAPYLREKGKLYAAFSNPDAEDSYQKKARTKFIAKLEANPTLYNQVVLTRFDPPEFIDIAPAESVDRVLTFRNAHNWYIDSGDKGVITAFSAFYRALKPGGILGIEEHRLPLSRSADDQKNSGYLHADYVIKMAEKAGFKLLATSEINANPKDKANYPQGVWTLPPSLRLGDTDREKYLAIGESDRMTLKFIKPVKAAK